MAIPRLAPAFAIVRNLLSEQPRSFQGLLSAAVAQPSPKSTNSNGETSASATSSVAVSRKGKAREAASGAAKERVPEGHPFVSATFLKNRILPVLESQHLIHLSPSKTSGSSNPTFKWSLGPPHSLASRPPPSTLPVWDSEKHWQRLLDGTHPGQTASEYAVHRAMEQSLRRDQAIKEGKVRMSEAEIREWAGRKAGIITRAERGHLNVRRERARGRKERERVALVVGGSGPSVVARQ